MQLDYGEGKQIVVNDMQIKNDEKCKDLNKDCCSEDECHSVNSSEEYVRKIKK